MMINARDASVFENRRLIVMFVLFPSHVPWNGVSPESIYRGPNDYKMDSK